MAVEQREELVSSESLVLSCCPASVSKLSVKLCKPPPLLAGDRLGVDRRVDVSSSAVILLP